MYKRLVFACYCNNLESTEIFNTAPHQSLHFAAFDKKLPFEKALISFWICLMIYVGFLQAILLRYLVFSVNGKNINKTCQSEENPLSLHVCACLFRYIYRYINIILLFFSSRFVYFKAKQTNKSDLFPSILQPPCWWTTVPFRVFFLLPVLKEVKPIQISYFNMHLTFILEKHWIIKSNTTSSNIPCSLYYCSYQMIIVSSL